MPKPAPRIPVIERLIVALDVPDAEAARRLVRTLDTAVHFYKIGLELATSGHYFELLQWLLERDKKVFADLKLYDVPATVAAAVRQMRVTGASMLTVHGDRSIMRAAVDEKGPLAILAVTVLTSLDEADLQDMGIRVNPAELALSRARQAIDCGCDGVIASGLEAAAMRAILGAAPLIVTPGIRSTGDRGMDDQKRVVTAGDAVRAGADYIVVGRPIRNARDPYAAACEVQAEIAAVVE
jgi:orotidine-5'-phosphate decarboxylase